MLDVLAALEGAEVDEAISTMEKPLELIEFFLQGIPLGAHPTKARGSERVFVPVE